MNNCKLCQHPLPPDNLQFEKDKRHYFFCSTCFLIQVTPQEYPSREQAIKRYNHHIKGAGNKGHIHFLHQAINPTLPFMSSGNKCLDYGCGPVPTLPCILSPLGFFCDIFDPYYNFSQEKETCVHHVFCLETAEHFFEPNKEFEHLFELILPGGTLTLMTEWYENLEQFSTWSYKRDITHVVFYHQKTMEYIANRYKVPLVYSDHERVAVFKKNL
ncbi:MAG: methyltransferase domain-containing protein [Saprospiraceae bacterium]